jgi:precorrin-6A/cobalt-precorrin-6A reductase
MTVLLLGGTAEARALARVLHERDLPLVSSLAGRVQRPRMPVGDTRVGGFGGSDGLAAYLREEQVTAVVDATHPFAAGISANAAAACRAAGVPLLRLARRGWADEPGAGRWHWVDDHDAAARTAAGLGSRVLLTTGRQQLDRFTRPLAGHAVLARVVDPVEEPLPSGWQVLLDRGPYLLEGELALMRRHGTEVLVTKDSGGGHTRAKLDAADALGVEVVVVRRPPDVAGVVTVPDVDAAARWLASLPSSRRA